MVPRLYSHVKGPDSVLLRCTLACQVSACGGHHACSTIALNLFIADVASTLCAVHRMIGSGRPGKQLIAARKVPPGSIVISVDHERMELASCLLNTSALAFADDHPDSFSLPSQCL